ncbi:MAG: glycosyltransferase family 4 protein [Anaerolineae bacterium]|nr:glycosyltransferase family 4 protein [Anaerolineae bacterium]
MPVHLYAVVNYTLERLDCSPPNRYTTQMHIGIDTRLTYYRTGGISTYMRRLVLALESLDMQNRYTILHSRKAFETLTKRFQRANIWTPCHHRFERLALSVELAPFKLDILHSPDFIPPIRGAQRHIITVHDLTFLHYPQFLTPDARRYYNDQIATAVRQADHILADSTATKIDLINMLSVPSEKITVHMLGVDERFQPLPQNVLEQRSHELNLPDAYILFVGTLEPRKNIIGLLKAYQLLIENLPDAPPIMLVGRQGWLFEDMQKQMDSLKLGSHLIWREDITDESLPVVYNRASMLVLPSFYEGFGFPALEAMACGTVPIVSNRSSLPEVVGDVGLQINPDDPNDIASAMEHALNHTHWRKQMQQAGLKRAKTFTWEQTASIVLSVYRATGTHT